MSQSENKVVDTPNEEQSVNEEIHAQFMGKDLRVISIKKILL